MGKIADKIVDLFTGDKEKVPLLYVHFNYRKYQKNGSKGSCIASVHPELVGDMELKKKIEELIDYIRDNNDMEKIVTL